MPSKLRIAAATLGIAAGVWISGIPAGVRGITNTQPTTNNPVRDYGAGASDEAAREYQHDMQSYREGSWVSKWVLRPIVGGWENLISRNVATETGRIYGRIADIGADPGTTGSTSSVDQSQTSQDPAPKKPKGHSGGIKDWELKK